MTTLPDRPTDSLDPAFVQAVLDAIADELDAAYERGAFREIESRVGRRSAANTTPWCRTCPT